MKFLLRCVISTCDFTQENVDPETQESPMESSSGETERCRELTEEDIQVIWKNVTLTQ